MKLATATSTYASTSSQSTPAPLAKLRVLIVDDHPVTRQGMKALIDQQLNLEVGGEADSAARALELLSEVKPDLALVDVSLGATNGLELTRTLKERSPNLPILVVSMHDEMLFAERALRAGAMGYVMKQEAGEKVGTAIQHLLRGEIYLSPKLKDWMLHRMASRKGDGVVFAIDTLSERERQVFELLGNGFSTRQIAQQLGLSTKTIDSYREHLKLKFNLSSGADLVRHAIQWARTDTV